MDTAWNAHLRHLTGQDIGVTPDSLGWSDEPDALMSGNHQWTQSNTDEASFHQYRYPAINGDGENYGGYEEDMGDEGEEGNEDFEPDYEDDQVDEDDQGDEDYQGDEDDQEDEDYIEPGQDIPQANPGTFQPTISSEADYIKELEERSVRERAALIESGAEVDFPEDPAEQRECVRRLVEAFKNTVEIIDKGCKNGRAAQSAQRITKGYYPDHEIEMACWEIFLRCRDAQLGVRLVGEHHTGCRREGEAVHPTFQDRFDKIIKACAKSKAVCKQVLDPDYICRLVDAPRAEIQMKLNNKRINSERDKQNEIGRRAAKFGIKEATTLAEILHPIVKEEDRSDTPTTPIRRTHRAPSKSNYPTLRTPTRSSSSNPRTPTNLASSAPVTPSKSGPARHGSTNTTSIGKRKRRTPSSSLSKLINADDDYDNFDDENDDDPSFSPSPPKRSSTKRSKAKVAARKERTTPTKRQTPANSSSQGVAESSANLPLRRQSKGSASKRPSHSSANVSETLDGDSKGLNKLYRETICDILGVDRVFADRLDLRQLRTYARAYNKDFSNDEWYDETLLDRNVVGTTHRLQTDRGILDHFCHLMPEYAGIAFARGDCNDNGTFNSDSTKNQMFDTKGDSFMNKALGVIPNEFNLHKNLWNINPPLPME